MATFANLKCKIYSFGFVSTGWNLQNLEGSNVEPYLTMLGSSCFKGCCLLPVVMTSYWLSVVGWLVPRFLTTDRRAAQIAGCCLRESVNHLKPIILS